MLPPNHFKKLTEDGWCTFDLPLDVNTSTIAAALGTLMPSRPGGPLVDRLAPTQRVDGNPRSLTAIYGTGEFPFHTDSAYVRIPPRYLLLRLVDGATDRPTRIVDTQTFDLGEEHLHTLEHDVWVVNGGRRRFLASMVSHTIVPGRRVFRFDRHCMRPAHAKFGKSAEIIAEFCRTASPIDIRWAVGHTLVIDNWRMLHARGASADAMRETRVLERALVSMLMGVSE